MNRRAGSILRRTGLILEVLGVIGVLDQRGENLRKVTIPHLGVVSPAWCALAVGFVLYLAGTFLYYRKARPRPPEGS